MDLTAIKNQLITYKNYSNLPKNLVNEIQDTLLTKSKEGDFIALLKRVEQTLGESQSIKK